VTAFLNTLRFLANPMAALSCRRICVVVCGLGGFAGVGYGGESEDEEGKPEVMPDFRAAMLLPLDVPSRGFRVATFEDEVLATLITVGVMTRVDDRHLKLEDMYLYQYAESGEELILNVIEGDYDFQTGQLISGHPTRITGPDYEIRGEGCIYEEGAESIKLLGNIDSVLYISMDGDRAEEEVSAAESDDDQTQ